MPIAIFRGANEKKYILDVFLTNNDQFTWQMIITET